MYIKLNHQIIKILKRKMYGFNNGFQQFISAIHEKINRDKNKKKQINLSSFIIIYVE
jgi:protoporphyrinogen oxidase